MFEHATDWIELVVRWVHIVTGVTWIGTSFYFNWLNNHVRESDGLEPGVAGDLWSVHGGAFYRVVKYRVAPEKLPKVLHWFKWEAYFTWISGFSLLAIVYWLNAETFMVDSSVMVLEPWKAVAIGAATLLVGWLVYHLLCKSPLGKQPLLFGIVVFALIGGAALALTQVLGSRAAYIHIGALIGTIMAANVFFVIIPNQKVMVDAMTKGEEPDPQLGIDGAQRSLHNNYFTLPVLFIMVSNHYPFTYGDEWNWAILIAISLAGALTRHWFNVRGKGEKNVWVLPVAAAIMLGLAFVTMPKTYADAEPVEFAEVRTIIETHCVRCHSATPDPATGFVVAPQNVMFDTRQQIQSVAGRINTQVVVTKVMPLANQTGMTQEERDLIGAWFHQGAKID
jgi:uncharacterized membrane protein